MQFVLIVPTIRDRVVQTAAKLLLEPIFEADFDPNAYGYRPKRSAQEAIQKVHKLLCAGYADVVDADLSKYFDTIPHSELMQTSGRVRRKRVFPGYGRKWETCWVGTTLQRGWRYEINSREFCGGGRTTSVTERG